MTDLVLSTLNLHTKKDNDYKKVFTLSLPNNFLNKKEAKIPLWLSYIVSGANSEKKKSEYYTVYFSQFLWIYLSLFDFFNRESNIKKCQREEVKCGQCVWKVACGITVFSILQFFFFFFFIRKPIHLPIWSFKKNIYIYLRIACSCMDWGLHA